MVLISMKEEWKCVLLTSGEQCVVPLGTAMMQLWSASNWDMLSLMVRSSITDCLIFALCTQLEQQEQMHTLVLVLGTSI